MLRRFEAVDGGGQMEMIVPSPEQERAATMLHALGSPVRVRPMDHLCY